ncbi:hypothetical protein E3N88_23565 [Mikania micrantha]|uniref:Uncharacterized protein n=1 Tax=Mikania micrantha TaxID=192012 RepID=A0A5N6NDV4_9ASTR|nr:hypothetical protein E3N88_23565 [Mikania micrantha]
MVKLGFLNAIALQFEDLGKRFSQVNLPAIDLIIRIYGIRVSTIDLAYYSRGSGTPEQPKTESGKILLHFITVFEAYCISHAFVEDNGNLVVHVATAAFMLSVATKQNFESNENMEAYGSVCNLIAEAYCVRAFRTQETEPNSKQYVEDMDYALKLWLTQEHSQAVLLHHIRDFFYHLRKLFDHALAIEMPCHALCTSRVDEAFFATFSKHDKLSNSVEHWQSSAIAWLNDKVTSYFDFILTPWNVFCRYLERLLQVGTVEEIVGNGSRAENI